MTYEKYEARANNRAKCAQQRDGPPLEQRTQRVTQRLPAETGRVQQRSHGSPEPRFGYLADVRVYQAGAEADAKPHQHVRQVQQRGRVRETQKCPSGDARHVRENHTALFAEPLL